VVETNGCLPATLTAEKAVLAGVGQPDSKGGSEKRNLEETRKKMKPRETQRIELQKRDV